MSEYQQTEQLAKLIDAKHDVLQQLRELSRRQMQTVESADMKRLLTVLSAKQLLLKDLQQVEVKLDPYRPQDPETRCWRSPAAREQCRQVAQRCESLLQEIMLMEKRCESVLVDRRNEAASRLDEAHDATAARRAYSQQASPRRNQIDLSTQ